MQTIPENKPQAIKKLKDLYSDFTSLTADEIKNVYAPDIIFKDPIHVVRGINPMINYFENLQNGLDSCSFNFNAELAGEHEAFITWKMQFTHASFKGKQMELNGVSHLRYHDRIFYHEDYYDLGAMVYEHVPVLGMAVKKIKSRLQQ